MNEEEVIKDITSKPKYYIGIINQGTASNFIKRWRQGKVKQKSFEKFIAKFGYEIKNETTYFKKS